MKRPPHCWGGQFDGGRVCCLRDQCLRTSSAASRAASLTSPAALCISPLALSALPSACSFLSPVSLPAASFTAPLALSAAPLMCSRSIVSLHHTLWMTTDRRRERSAER